MKKRILLMALLVLLPMFSMTACKSDGDGGEIVLKWGVSMQGQKDDQRVLDIVNEKLKELMPGVKLELVKFSREKWTQQMASHEVFDIAWTGYSMNMDAEIKNKSYTPLNDLITKETTPNIWREWNEEYQEEYDTAVVDGKLYAIPNQQPLVPESSILKIPASIFEYFDVDAFRAAAAKSPTTNREVYEVLDKFFEKIYSEGVVDTDVVAKYIDIQNMYEWLVPRGYSEIGSRTEIIYKTFNDDKVDLTHIAYTDEYKLFLEYAAKWFQDGYIAKDVLVSGGGSGSRISPFTMHTNGMWFKLDDPERGIMKVYDKDGDLEQYYVNIEPEDGSHLSLGCSRLGSQQTYLTVPYTSKHPKEAIKFLDLMRSPIGTPGNEILNLLVYGIEGEHYELQGDLAIGNGYTLQASMSNNYGKPHWAMGNVFLTYRTPNILEGQAEYAKTVYKEKLNNAYKTPLYRFRVNTSKLTTPIFNVASVILEYNERLRCGIDGSNYMNTYNEYINKLEVAGIKDIINEIKSQTDAYTPPA